jgi:hypothetical protein
LRCWVFLFLLCQGLPSCLFPSGAPPKTSHIVTCPTHLIILVLLTHVLFDEECKSWTPCYEFFFQFPVTSLLASNSVQGRYRKVFVTSIAAHNHYVYINVSTLFYSTRLS